MTPRKRRHVIYGEIIVSFVGGNVECCVDYYEYDSERSEHACVDIETICDAVLCEVTNQDECWNHEVPQATGDGNVDPCIRNNVS